MMVFLVLTPSKLSWYKNFEESNDIEKALGIIKIEDILQEWEIGTEFFDVSVTGYIHNNKVVNKPRTHRFQCETEN
jgi:hypothetical protein